MLSHALRDRPAMPRSSCASPGRGRTSPLISAWGRARPASCLFMRPRVTSAITSRSLAPTCLSFSARVPRARLPSISRPGGGPSRSRPGQHRAYPGRGAAWSRKSTAARLRGAHRHQGNVAVLGHEHDRPGGAGSGKLGLEFQPASAPGRRISSASGSPARRPARPSKNFRRANRTYGIRGRPRRNRLPSSSARGSSSSSTMKTTGVETFESPGRRPLDGASRAHLPRRGRQREAEGLPLHRAGSRPGRACARHAPRRSSRQIRRQPHTASLALGREEGIEQTRRHVVGNAGSAIVEEHHGHVAARLVHRALRANRQGASIG